MLDICCIFADETKTKTVPSIFKKTLIAALCLILLSGCDRQRYLTITGFAQGSTYHTICSLPGHISEKQAGAEIDSILNAIDNSLSGYNKGSLLSRINAGEDIPLDNIFIECFERSKQFWEESQGAFDPSAAPLFDIWGFGFEEGTDVTQADIDSILQFVGMDKVSLEIRDDGTTHLVKEDPRIKLNFNAIAQGLSCDLIARHLQMEGSENYLVEVGREIVCKGSSARGDKWRIGIDKPIDGNMDEGANLQEIIEVGDRGVVTSGNYRKFYIKDGKKYAHTIDPRTGRPVEHSLLSATILAPDATTADACATWMMVIGPQKAREVVDSRPDLDGYLITDEGLI